MKIKTMKIIDKYIGMPLSVLILLYEKLKRLFIKRKRPDKIKKILLMKFFGMGSIILSIPLVNLIKKNFPDATITFLTFNQNRELTDILKLTDKYYFIRNDSLFNFIVDIMKILIKLRREKYDGVIDLEFFSNFSLTMSYLSCARWRCGYYVRGTARGYILDTTVYFNQLKHVTEVFAMLISGLKNELSVNPPIEYNLGKYLNLTGENNFLKEKAGLKKDGKPLIVLNVNASELCKERMWPAEKFIQLSEYLIQNYDAKLIFIGADCDYDYVKNVVSKIKNKENVFNFAGGTTLKDLINLLMVSDLFISNDSGPLHLASLLGKPSVSFFGPETPKLYGPLNGRHLVFYKDVYCSPCLNVYNAKTSACNGKNICMAEITVDEVINGIEKSFNDILKKGNQHGF